MKHIKLFEEVSSALPSKHTAESIRRMSVDELDKVVEIYHREGKKDEAHSLIKIWLDSNPYTSLSGDDLSKFVNFMEKCDALDLFDQEKVLNGRAMEQYIKMGGNPRRLEYEIRELEAKLAEKKELLDRIKGLKY